MLAAEKRRLKHLEPTPKDPNAVPAAPVEEEVLSDDSDAVGFELTNPAVDRGDKYNRSQVNRKRQLRLIDAERKKVKEEKLFKNQFNMVTHFVKEDARQKVEIVKGMKTRQNIVIVEREL